MVSADALKSIESLHLLKHPFYQAWMEGKLSKETLQNYAVQYFPHVKSFPRFVSAVHSLCEDDVARPVLAHNLADEEGITGGQPHPELWLNFAEELGVPRAQVVNAKTARASQELVDGFTNYCRSTYAEGLGALLAYEYQVPEIAETKIAGLREHYGIESQKALEFFKVHQQADVYHSNGVKQAFDRLSPAEKEKAQAAAHGASQLLWNFLSEAYEQSA